MLRLLYSRLSTPHIGSPQAFAFNVPSVTGGGALKTVKAGRTVVERKHSSTASFTRRPRRSGSTPTR